MLEKVVLNERRAGSFRIQQRMNVRSISEPNSPLRTTRAVLAREGWRCVGSLLIRSPSIS